MVVIHVRRYEAVLPEVSWQIFSNLLKALEGDEFKPTFKPARDLQANLMGFEVGGLMSNYAPTYQPSASLGELFVSPDQLHGIGYFHNTVSRFGFGEKPSASHIVSVCHISRQPEASDREIRFNSLVAESLATPLTKVEYLTDRAQSFLNEEKEQSIPQLCEDEVRASKALSDRDTRDVAIFIKSTSGGVLKADLVKKFKRIGESALELHLSRLVEHKLVEEESVVVCRKTGAVVVKLASAELIGGSRVDESIRCACGTALKDERFEPAFASSKSGQILLDKSRWMTIYLNDALIRNGIHHSRIFVEQKHGEDEMDCFAIIGGHLFLFELKDKDFKQGNAYAFAAKMGITRPDYAIIVSTGKIDSVARDHFHKTQAAAPYTYQSGNQIPIYIEGLDDLIDNIETIVVKRVKQQAEAFLQGVVGLASIYPRSLMEQYLGPTWNRRMRSIPELDR
jgi:hypothetical protein